MFGNNPSKLNTDKDNQSKHETWVKRIVDSTDKKQRRKLTLWIFAALVLLAAVSVIIQTITPSQGMGRCDSILYTAQKYNCIQNLAVSKVNASICSYLPSPYTQNCIDSVALKSSNISVCTEQSNHSISDQCIYNFSESSNDVSYCSQLSNSTLKSECIYYAAQSGHLSSESYCNEISNSSENGYCTIIYNYDSALKYNDTSYCGSIPNTTYPGLPWYTLIDSYQTPSTSNYTFLLEAGIYNLTYRELCYSSIYYASGKNLFQNVNYPNYAGNSYNVNLTSICDKANFANNDSAACYFSSLIRNASITNNPKYCLSANNTNYANICVLSVAYKYKNVSDCNYATDNAIKSICINNATNIINTT